MSKRSKGHMSKSSNERAQYVRYIKTQDYEPTQEEGLDFDDTNDKDEDYSVGKTNKPKRLTTKEQLQEHFNKHWIEYLIGGAGIVAAFFIFTAQIDLNKHEFQIEQNKSGLENLNTKVEENTKHDNQQDLQIQENKIRLEYVNERKKDTTKNAP